MRLPRLLKPLIDVAIPWNVLEESPDEREKVRKIGYLCRGAAIFQASKLIVYTYGRWDPSETKFLVRNLEYLVTPPYLRKQLFKIEPELKLAGLLPPLRTPSHYSTRERPKPGDIVEGIVVRWDGYYSIVKIGETAYAKLPRPHPIGTRLTLRIEAESGHNVYRAHIVNIDKLNVYWNLRVEQRSLRELLEDKSYDVVILTGREGEDLCRSYRDLMAVIRRARENDKRVLVLFGSPKHGVDEILRLESISLERDRYLFLNFVPEQGVETIRTEEAVIAVLSILHFIRTCLA